MYSSLSVSTLSGSNGFRSISVKPASGEVHTMTASSPTSGFRRGFVDSSFDAWVAGNRDLKNFTFLVTYIFFVLRSIVRYPFLVSQYTTKICSSDFRSHFFHCPELTWTIAEQPKTFKFAKFGLRPNQASSGVNFHRNLVGHLFRRQLAVPTASAHNSGLKLASISIVLAFSTSAWFILSATTFC
ncbi:hypothetical protein T4D_14453 [Trichinella pseudospiralis]|uniref:Uncharacterized protein n=1 Tax=Trichinella pseudospiralis TaxID=6337 RepID=A0A0V1F565_TRIPS|nr:hypothetical protein T4D_14453 [Trichinella pseudospiralis]